MAKKTIPQVPVCLSGLVQRLAGPGFCMDGATHVLENVGVRVRIAPRNRALSVS